MLDLLNLHDTVIDAAREVFETMVFMDVETNQEVCPVIDGQSLLGSITFKGSLEGCLVVRVSQSCAESIAKNMLGIESQESLALEESCDAIGEVTNMVMGSIKTRLQNLYPAIEVSIPTVITGYELKNILGDKAVKKEVCVWLDEKEPVQFSFMYRENQTYVN
jgi:CheY-specific phosphatase CheX